MWHGGWQEANRRRRFGGWKIPGRDSMCETLQEHVPGGTTRSEAVVWEERSKVQKVRSGRWAGAGFRKALRPRTGLGF